MYYRELLDRGINFIIINYDLQILWKTRAETKINFNRCIHFMCAHWLQGFWKMPTAWRPLRILNKTQSHTIPCHKCTNSAPYLFFHIHPHVIKWHKNKVQLHVAEVKVDICDIRVRYDTFNQQYEKVCRMTYIRPWMFFAWLAYFQTFLHWWGQWPNQKINSSF